MRFFKFLFIFSVNNPQYWITADINSMQCSDASYPKIR